MIKKYADIMTGTGNKWDCAWQQSIFFIWWKKCRQPFDSMPAIHIEAAPIEKYYGLVFKNIWKDKKNVFALT